MVRYGKAFFFCCTSHFFFHHIFKILSSGQLMQYQIFATDNIVDE